MDTEISVVGIAGSRRPGSHTRTAVEIVLAAAAESGATVELIDLREQMFPPFDPEARTPEQVRSVRTQLRAADAIVLGSPMYHGSYSGVLKNAIDHCGFEEFADKTVGLLAVSGGRFPVTALDHLRSVCRALNAWVLPYEAAIPQSDSAIGDGTIHDERLEDRVRTLGRRVVKYAVITPHHQDSFEGDENIGA